MTIQFSKWYQEKLKMPGGRTGDSRRSRRNILSVTVDIEDGRTEHIVLKEGDIPEEVSKKFCNDHHLPPQFIAPLTEHISNNVSTTSKEKPKSAPSSSKDMKTDKKRDLKSDLTLTHLIQNVERPVNVSPENKHLTNEASCSTTSKPQHDLPISHTKQHKKQRLSDRLLAPTRSSTTKAVVANPPEKAENKDIYISDPLPDKVRATSLRLYTEFVRQQNKLEDEAQLLMEEYKEKIEREKPVCSKRSKKLMRAREKAAAHFSNYGELLYREAIAKQIRRQNLCEKKQKEDEMNEIKHLNPTPEISKFAKELSLHESVWERLINHKPDEKRLQEKRQQLWEMRFMECTFKPHIRRYRAEGVSEEPITISRFDHLFYDAEHRRKRQEELEKWFPDEYTFQPQITSHPSINLKNVEAGENVFNRLVQYANKVVEKKRRVQHEQELADRIDPTTSRDRFRPSTGRKPLIERNVDSLPIGEFLYRMASLIARKKIALAAKNNPEIQICHTGRRSEALLEHMQENRLRRIFEYLDVDKDGKVDLNTIDKSRVTEEALHEIEQIKALQGFENPISVDKFVNLMTSVQSGSKLSLLKTKKTGDYGHPFKFKMAPLSRSLAKERRKFRNYHEWYELLVLEDRKRLEKLESQKKEKELSEMKECTFTPIIHPGKNRNKKGLTINGDIAKA